MVFEHNPTHGTLLYRLLQAYDYLLTHVRTWLQTARLVYSLDAEANEAATMNQGSQSVLPDKAARVGFGGGAVRQIS